MQRQTTLSNDKNEMKSTQAAQAKKKRNRRKARAIKDQHAQANLIQEDEKEIQQIKMDKISYNENELIEEEHSSVHVDQARKLISQTLKNYYVEYQEHVCANPDEIDSLVTWIVSALEQNKQVLSVVQQDNFKKSFSDQFKKMFIKAVINPDKAKEADGKNIVGISLSLPIASNHPLLLNADSGKISRNHISSEQRQVAKPMDSSKVVMKHAGIKPHDAQQTVPCQILAFEKSDQLSSPKDLAIATQSIISNIEENTDNYFQEQAIRNHEYAALARIPKRTRAISMDIYQEAMKSIKLHWLHAGVEFLCDLIDIHFNQHQSFVLLNRYPELKKQRELYSKKLARQKQNFALISNALVSINMMQPIHAIHESPFFERVVKDIDDACMDYLDQFYAYYNDLYSRSAAAIEAEVKQHIKKILNVFFEYIKKVAILFDFHSDRSEIVLSILPHDQDHTISQLYDAEEVYLYGFLKRLNQRYQQLNIFLGKLNRVAPRLIQSEKNKKELSRANKKGKVNKNKGSRRNHQKTRSETQPLANDENESFSKDLMFSRVDAKARTYFVPNHEADVAPDLIPWQLVYGPRAHSDTSLMDKANRHLKQRKYPQAIKCYQKILTKQSDNQEANLGLAYCFEQINEYEKSYEILHRLSSENKNEFDYQKRLINVCIKQRCFTKAIDLLNAMIVQWEANSSILRLLGVCYSQVNRYVDAAYIYQRLLERNPENIFYRVDYAYCFAALGRVQEALDRLNNLPEEEKKICRVLMAYVYIYFKLMQDFEKVVLFCQENMEHIKRYPRILRYYIKSLIRLERYSEAENALNLNREFFTILDEYQGLWLDLYKETGNFQSALNIADEMMKQPSPSKNALFCSAIAYRLAKKWKEALRAGELLKQLYTSFYEGHLQLIIIKAEMNPTQNFVAEFKQLIAQENFSNCVNIYFWCGLHLLNNCKEYDEAEQWVRSSIERFPYSQKLHLLLIDILIKMKNHTEIRDELKKITDQFPGSNKFNKYVRKYLRNDTEIFDNEQETVLPSLPDIVLNAFKYLKGPLINQGGLEQRIILVGSAVPALMDNQLTEEAIDHLDFSIGCLPEVFYRAFPAIIPVPHTQAIAIEFPSEKNKNIRLYVTFFNLLQSDLNQSDEHWYVMNARSRNYRICSLFVLQKNDQGYLLDPMRKGKKDWERKYLNTNNPYPNTLISADPLNFCIAMKYIHRGYLPKDRLVDALKNWPLDKIEHYYAQILAELIAQLSKNIDKENQIELIKLYLAYKGLHKIFAHFPDFISPDLNQEDIDELFLEKFIQLLHEEYALAMSKIQSLMFQPKTWYRQTSNISIFAQPTRMKEEEEKTELKEHAFSLN